MSETVISPQEPTRNTYVTMSSSLNVGAKWYTRIGRVVVGDVDHVLSIQMTPDKAATLAADLIRVVAESGASAVPAVVLDAFDNAAEKLR
ncbi:hypothetical protein [Haloactinopolyspora sp.]|uniref:hypothetical protein n=1 Tax=Haloactinopolyspora sp. TaxID=1966353 RepID=UPI002636D813|nr:hypothetical protein [Haloactinopolyspora sp.]